MSHNRLYFYDAKNDESFFFAKSLGEKWEIRCTMEDLEKWLNSHPNNDNEDLPRDAGASLLDGDTQTVFTIWDENHWDAINNLKRENNEEN